MNQKKNSPLPRVVQEIWQNRYHIEVEAAAVFASLARDLSHIWGTNDKVAALARQACQEELRHAALCCEILEIMYEPKPLGYQIQLGPSELSTKERVLYACISLSCITETLSTALLIEMLKNVKHEVIKKTVHEILNDEVRHSRIGWAEIARADSIDLAKLSKYIPEMIEGALTSEIGPMLSSEQAQTDFSPWGVLSPQRSQALMAETIESVILPGLKQNGIVLTS